MMEVLNRSNIADAPEFPIKILQFGGGNFLRAFLGWMVEVLNEETGFAGDIALVKPTPSGSYKALRDQQGLYHVLLEGIKNGEPISELKRIHCVRRITNPYEAWGEFLATARLESLAFVVSNTTEAGIRYETAPWPGHSAPHTFPAKLTLWLYERFTFFEGDFHKGCVILPCELIEDNGTALKECVLKYAGSWQLGAAFSAWIADANTFCNTLVDRIVTGYPTESALSIEKELGYRDQQLVAAEPYHSWLIQGPEFLPGLLPVAHTSLNIRFVKDLRPYRDLKVRILNGTHTLMVPVGVLLGLRYVRECLEAPSMRSFLEALLEEELCLTLDLPATEVQDYKNSVVERFLNPYINHRLLDIALHSMAKFRTRVLPSLEAYYQRYQQLPRHLLFGFAALLRFYKTGSGEGAPAWKDSPENFDFFGQLWARYPGGPEAAIQLVAAVVRHERLWGSDLGRYPGLKEQLARYLHSIEANGIKKAMEHL